MTGHFTLDLDPSALQLAKRSVRALATDLERDGNLAQRTPEREAVARWTGGAASSIKPEMTALGGRVRDWGTCAEAIATALGETENVARDAVDALPDLNRRWEESWTTYEAAVDRATRQFEAATDVGPGERAPVGWERRVLVDARTRAGNVAFHELSTTRALITAEFDTEREAVAMQVRALSRVMVEQTPIEVPQAALTELGRTGTPPAWSLDTSGLTSDLQVTRAYLDETDPTAPYELALREAGLLDGPPPTGFYEDWLENAARQGAAPETLVEVARVHDIDAADFAVLDGLEEIEDPDGKSFFVLPEDISAGDARAVVVMTYVLNAGTDYAEASTDNDFEETPYSAAEVQRILERQSENAWFSYDQDVGFVHGNGGRMVSTPNGMLMGLGGNFFQDIYSQQGGTTYGDIFMLNIDDADDPVAAMRAVVTSGRATYEDDDGDLYQGSLDLDRLLHHEERHSQQWAREGYAGFLASYGWEQLTGGNGTEEDAGLHDGGYE